MGKVVLLASLFLVSCDQESDMKKRPNYPAVPEKDLKGVARTNLDSPKPTSEQLKRKKKSMAIVAKMGLPTLESLPVVEDELQIRPRAPEEVAQRCLAVTICAVKGETGDQKLVESLVGRFSASEFFSPKEAAFIRDAKPLKQDLVDFAWRYECGHVLLWALGRLDSIKGPHEICDVPGEMKIIRETGAKAFVSEAKVRPLSEILDMADLYYRLHWAAIELRLKGKTSDAANEEIIRERHRALNWLIRYLDQAWDNITTDT
jgi:hypothetical protein